MRLLVVFVFFLLLFVLEPPANSDVYRPSVPNKALILYDATGDKGWVGYLNGLFLANLLGHFSTLYDLTPVEGYTKGLLDSYKATFYLGTQYNNQLPKAFIDDVLQTTRPIVWFRYNLWTLIAAHPDFSAAYGFEFLGMDSSGFDQITYKNSTFDKNQRDSELGLVALTNPDVATIWASALQKSTEMTIPYIVQGGHVWYVADIPFTYLSENDRYLVFADLLYDILDVKPPQTKRALIRLEDIDPTYNTTTLRAAADYLYSEGVPFAIAVIPYYRDPLGYYTGGLPEFVQMTEVPDFVDTLKYMISKGGTVILHGYTHQYSDKENAHTGVSGDDYEFFRVTSDTLLFQPVDEDSEAWVEDRVKSALSLLETSGLSATIWETPHYVASDSANHYFSKAFLSISGRVLYFDKQDLTHYAGQFFPYVIQQDSYGQKIIPENLGCVSPEEPGGTVDDLVRVAKNNLVMHDAWASMYYHPFLGLSYLQQLIPSIKALGYEFVPMSTDLI
jgi:uncharacterized protein YdaL